MILVDTSVIIDYFKGNENRRVRSLDQILLNGIPCGINNFIYQELLQGSRTIEEFQTQKKYLGTMPFYYLKNDRESYEKAAYLNLKCRGSGILLRRLKTSIVMPDLIRHPFEIIVDSGCRRNDTVNTYYCRVNKMKFYSRLQTQSEGRVEIA